MKKYTLIAVLALFVVASLVSGSLAIYNSVVEVGEGEMKAASFVLKADGVGDSFGGNLNIAPGDKTNVDINLHNYSDDVGITETDMKVVVELTVDTEIFPLLYALYDSEGNLLEGQETKLNADGTTTVTWDSDTAVFEKNVKKDITYKVIFDWTHPATTPEGVEIPDTDYVNLPCNYKINVTGTQITGTTYNTETVAPTTDTAPVEEPVEG